MSNLLLGSFDLHIIDTCNLHCSGCIVLDYLQDGRVTNTRYELSDVKIVMENLKRLDLRLDELKILGGEPTLHKNLDEIIDYLKNTNLINKLTLITNGLNFTPVVVRSLMKLDRLVISVYPFEEDLSNIVKNSYLYDYLKSNVKIEFWWQNTFDIYGQKQSNLEYSNELNWERCYQKDDCRVITKEYLFRCTTTYSGKRDMCKWDDRQKVIDFIESNIPLSHCNDCPFPPLQMKWNSNNLPMDRKNFYRGVDLINEYSKI